MTEKIAKPIAACRLFIVLSSKHYLRNLRSLGFQTFGNVIDESYDDQADNNTRWQMAIDQAVELCQKPQAEILHHIAPIVIHNYEHMKYLRQNLSRVEIEKLLVQAGLENQC